MDDDAKWINNRLKEVFKDAKRKNENDKSLSIHRYCVPVCVCACACLRESVGCIENVQRLCVMPKEDSVMDVSVLYTTLLSVLLLDSE
uniref:Bm10137 n=1 Tax=Brugia malayi TaxID=6279 RepID=A0A0J9XWZ0_BRUMA|nr:Bm10137 [Brugia malayi]